jgi:hypothetical protein
MVLIPRARKEERVMRRLGHRRIMNDMKREISKLMGISMTM